MDSNRPRNSSTGFEYFLYAAIVAETALAALIYKVIVHTADLGHLRVYFALFYLAFLAWVIVQLQVLHRKRQELAQVTEAEIPAAAALPAEDPETAKDNNRHVLGLTSGQLVVVVVVFATAVVMFSLMLSRLG
jgi:hypothetical protein